MSSGKKDTRPHLLMREKVLAHRLMEALHIEHAKNSSAIKHIARLTGVDATTVRYWHEGRSTPKSSHLVMLMATYPSVLKIVLESIGMPELWEAACAQNLPQRMQQRWRHTSHVARSWGDMHVTPLPPTAANQRPTENTRQQWFLAQLRQGREPHAQDIAEHWRVSLRTAKRDLADLVAAGAIRFERHGKGGWYMIMEGCKHP